MEAPLPFLGISLNDVSLEASLEWTAWGLPLAIRSLGGVLLLGVLIMGALPISWGAMI